MKKKGTQTVENTTEDELKPTEEDLKRRRRQKMATEADGGGQKGQTVEKTCSEWTTGGLERQDGAGRP